MLQDRIQKDYDQYIEFAKQREKLSVKNDELRKIYKYLYIFSVLAESYSDCKDKAIYNYICEAKVRLFLAFNLLDENYVAVSKQILRTSIEVFFRFLLLFYKDVVHTDRLARREYGTCDELQMLLSNSNTQSIGRMTKYISEYFKIKIENPYIDELVSKYSLLSSDVHPNVPNTLALQKYFEDYLICDRKSVDSTIVIFFNVIRNYLYILYCLHHVRENVFLTKEVQQMFASFLTEDSLNDIDKKYCV